MKPPNPKAYQPFRYPGGKAKLAVSPLFRSLIDPLARKAECFYEGFLGSGAVTLDLALRFPNLRFSVSEKDENMAAFWRLVASGTEEEARSFTELILGFETNSDKVGYFKMFKAFPATTLVEKAYKALFFNRTTFSGIATSHPIGGFEQKSRWTIDCRYNADALVKKFRNLRALFKERLTVTQEDCLGWLRRLPPDVPMFLDPPYYVKGDMLYPAGMGKLEHKRLAETLKARTNWMLSYDICDPVTRMYEYATLLRMPFRYSINGVKKNWKKNDEYLIVSPEIDTSAFKVMPPESA